MDMTVILRYILRFNAIRNKIQIFYCMNKETSLQVRLQSLVNNCQIYFGLRVMLQTLSLALLGSARRCLGS
jgi:hypothetical protein